LSISYHELLKKAYKLQHDFITGKISAEEFASRSGDVCRKMFKTPYYNSIILKLSALPKEELVRGMAAVCVLIPDMIDFIEAIYTRDVESVEDFALKCLRKVSKVMKEARDEGLQ